MALRKDAPDVQVYVAGQLRLDVQCTDVSFGAGARGLGVATLVVQPALRTKGRRRMLNLELADFGQPEIEVRIAGRVVHWGKVLAQAGQIGSDGDPVGLISRMDEHHFGNPLYYARYFDPRDNQFRWYTLPTIFNPEFDGRAVGNMHNRQENGAYVFLHQESTETDAAIKYQGNFASFWSLAEAVHYLINACNGSQTYIQNPSLAELRRAMAGSRIFRNYEAPLGAYLPEQLDRILDPYGFSWCVDLVRPGVRKIRVFKLGLGKASQLKLQPPGATADFARSNLEACSLTADVGNRTFNAVAILGDYEQYESTFELVRAWRPEFDDSPIDELSKHDENWFANAPKQRAWRDWTLNEAGDYIGLRNAIRQPYNLDAIFGAGQYLERRRKFLPCISLLPDGSPQGNAGGVFVEWWDNDEGAWKPIDDLSPEGRQVRILERECGIRFDGPEVPEEIYAQGNYAKVRVTATIQSDKRIEFRETAKNTRLADVRFEVIDAASKFRYRQRDAGSRFAGVVDSVANLDDRIIMRQYAQQLLSAWNAATVEGSATLAGVDFNLTGVIGSTIGGIDGRKVGLSVGNDIPRFPTVVGCKLDIQGQQTVLSIDTFRGEGNGL